MSISSEKLYTEPGSNEEAELQREQERLHEGKNSSNDQIVRPRSRRRTGAKKGKGKKIALTLLVVGGLVAGSIFGTKAYYSHKETVRVDNLIAEYTTDDYVILPRVVSSDRAYDITYSDGAKLTDRLANSNINCININGQFYTPEGIDVAILTYDVTHITQVDAIRVNNEGQTMYMAPSGYALNGTHAIKYDTERVTKIVPVADDYSYITFHGASDWQLVTEPQIVHTLPFSVIQNSTLICDIPDGAVLNDNNECYGTLDLAPKKR